MPNIWPRYAHFLLACPAMTGLLMVWLFRRGSDEEIAATGFERGELLRKGYRWALWPTVLQFAIGPLALVTLPAVPGSTASVTIVFGISIVVSAIMCLLMFAETRRGGDKIGSSFGAVCTLMAIVILLMGAGRHLYREAAVSEHRELVKERTNEYMREVDAARAATAAQD
ncbi:hypothetical protein ACFSTD_23495 [Novosphingobium colocasiae]